MNKENMLDRLSKSLGCRNDTELSIFFGVARPTVGSWRARGSIPIDKVCEIAEKNNISLDYLYLGKKVFTRKFDKLGDYDYLLKKVLWKLSSTKQYKDTKPFQLAELALFICDQIDFNADYNDQIQLMDQIISWYINIVFGTNLEEMPPQIIDNDQDELVFFMKSIKDTALKMYNLYCLVQNFYPEETEELEKNNKTIEDFYSSLLSDGIISNILLFDPKKPSHHIYDSHINIKNIHNPIKTEYHNAKLFLRRKIDKLNNMGIEIKPEHLSNPNYSSDLSKKENT